ncbi:hypothetical protein FA203_20985, partial [Pseudomonas aeruginosa]|nr:hypothetical protein [Pseudomonas aeruginosa]
IAQCLGGLGDVYKRQVIKPVKWIDEVLQIALQYAPEPLPDAAPEMVAKDEKREPDSKERISTH